MARPPAGIVIVPLLGSDCGSARIIPLGCIPVAAGAAEDAPTTVPTRIPRFSTEVFPVVTTMFAVEPLGTVAYQRLAKSAVSDETAFIATVPPMFTDAVPPSKLPGIIVYTDHDYAIGGWGAD